MASNVIEELREKFQKIREFKAKAKKKMTAEMLATYEGFETMSLEQRERVTEAINEYARIVIMHFNHITRKRNETLKRSLSSIRLQSKGAQK